MWQMETPLTIDHRQRSPMNSDATVESRKRLAAHYESVYQNSDYFGQAGSLYRAFVSAIVGKSGVKVNARALDTACGQGYLSRYFAQHGLAVWCCDLSAAGLQSLNRYGALFKGKRVVGDALHPPFQPAFDLVFQRSCSLFKEGPDACREVVARLVDCARPGASVCVVVNSNLRGTGTAWFEHTPDTFREAFASPHLEDVAIYVVNKVDCLLLGRYSFCRPVTAVNILMSKFVNRSFEIVAFARRRPD